MSTPRVPRMHTAEHILNQTMVRLLHCDRCFSAHVNSKKSKCDYHFERPLRDEEAKQIETRVNAVLHASMPVTEEMIPTTEAAKRFNLSRLPDPDVQSVRIVSVGDYDACPCSGEHVADTSQIGTFRLTTHSFEDGVLRIRFKLEAPQE